MSSHDGVERETARQKVRFGLPGEPAVRVILLGALLTAPLMVLAVSNVGGEKVLWTNLQWSLASIVAFAATIVGARSSSGRAGTIRRAGAVAFGLWMLANLTWGLLALVGSTSIPSIATVFAAAMFVPAGFILVKAVHGRLTIAEEVAVYFDSALLVILIGTVLIVAHGAAALALPASPVSPPLSFRRRSSDSPPRGSWCSVRSASRRCRGADLP